MIVTQFTTVILAFFVNCNFIQLDFMKKIENAVTLLIGNFNPLI